MSLDHIRIVLSRPLYGGNVGAVCRAMMNMGLSDLAVVKPTLRLDEDEVQKMSLHAYALYQRRQEYPTLAEAVADCRVVAGTSARGGLYRAHCRTAREWAPELRASAEAGRVAVVFGPEDDGLRNDELVLCTRLIEIPSTERYRSLNLAQAVLICCYELYLASGEFIPADEASPEATSAARERMFSVWEAMLLNVGFMEADNAFHMMQGLRRILSRGALTDRDVRILMGIARQADWCASELRKYREFS
jgi:tRNA/rRNA methyltransferase